MIERSEGEKKLTPKHGENKSTRIEDEWWNLNLSKT